MIRIRIILIRTRRWWWSGSFLCGPGDDTGIHFDADQEKRWIRIILMRTKRWSGSRSFWCGPGDDLDPDHVNADQEMIQIRVILMRTRRWCNPNHVDADRQMIRIRIMLMLIRRWFGSGSECYKFILGCNTWILLYLASGEILGRIRVIHKIGSRNNYADPTGSATLVKGRVHISWMRKMEFISTTLVYSYPAASVGFKK